MGAKHRIRVEGCPYGLDEENPELPDKICMHPCEWRIDAKKFLNCAWIAFAEGPDKNKISLREMGKMLGMTHESVRSLLEEAKSKLPKTEEELEEAFGKLKHNFNRKTSSQKRMIQRSILAKLLDD